MGLSNKSINVAVYANYDEMTPGQPTTGEFARIWYPDPAGGYVTLSGSHFTRNGYTNKWAYSPDGVGANTLTFTKNGAAYAIWSPEDYLITYKLRDEDTNVSFGTSNVAAGNVVTTQEYNIEQKNVPLLSQSQLTRVGYTLSGWTADGSGNWGDGVYTQGQTFSGKWGNVTLLANWTPNIYTVTFDANRGNLYQPTDWPVTSPNPLVMYQKYGVGWFNDPTCEDDNDRVGVPTHAGYNFLKFTTVQGDGGIDITDNAGIFSSTTNIASDCTVYAHWEGKNINIALDPNGGTLGATASVVAKFDTDTLTPGSIAVPTKTGYSFVGWTITQDGTDVVINQTSDLVNCEGYVSEDKWRYVDDVTVYASWTINSYNLTIDGNGGYFDDDAAVTSKTATVAYQATYTLPAPTRVGYHLAGWIVTDGKDQGTTVSGGVVTMGYMDSTVEAVWEPDIYTITLDSAYYTDETTEVGEPSDDNGAVHTIYLKYDTSWHGLESGSDESIITAISTPEKRGFDFKGYFTRKTGGDKVVDADGTILDGMTTVFAGANGDTFTLYAHWERKTYSFTIEYTQCDSNVDAPKLFLNGSVGTEKLSDVELSVGENYVVNAVAFGSTISVTISLEIKDGRRFVINEGALPSITNLSELKIEPEGGMRDSSLAYKVYVAEKFALNFDGNGAEEGVPEAMDFLYGQTVDLTGLSTPSRNYFNFAGWNSEIDGSGDDYMTTGENNIFSKNLNQTLYAQWEGVEYTITLDSSNGSNIVTSEIDKVILKYDDGFYRTSGGEKITGGLKPVSAGYVFGGYFVERDASGETSGEQVVDENGNLFNKFTYFTSDAVIYAKWSPAEYKVSFDTNGKGEFTLLGDGDTKTNKKLSTKFNAPISFNLYLDVTKVEGYDLLGWYTATEGGDKILNADGSSAGASQYVDADGNWIYVVGDDENLTFYAQWQIKTYEFEINYKGFGGNDATDLKITAVGGGTVADETISFDAGNGKTIVSATFSKTAEIDITIESVNGENYFVAGGEISGIGSLSNKLSIKWIPTASSSQDIYVLQRYNITYGLNGGEGTAPETTKKAHGISADITAVKPTRTGYAFVSWNTAEDGSGTEYDFDDETKKTYVGNADLTLYAQWDANSYTVIYDANKPENASGEITGSTTSSTHRYGVLKELTANGFSLVGWTFVRWNTQADGKGTDYADGASVLNLTTARDGEVTLYAIWQANAYTITYNANKPENASQNIVGTMNNSMHVYDVEKNLSKNTYSLVGWAFAGWKDEAENSYSDEQAVKNLVSTENGNIVLFAQWTAEKVLVTFDANATGASVTPATKEYDFDERYGTLPVPVRTGYIFDGWFRGSDANDTNKIEDVTKVVGTKNDTTGKYEVTIYAHWTAKVYTITFDSNNGSAVNSIYVKYDDFKLYSTYTNGQVSGNVSADSIMSEREGYDFDGWTETKNGADVVLTKEAVLRAGNNYVQNIDDVAVWKHDGDVTIYAKWIIHELSITANLHDGNGFAVDETTNAGWTIQSSGSTATKKVNYGAAYGVLPVAYRNGYKHIGWSKTAGSTIVDVEPTTIMGNSDQVIYPVWEVENFTVKYFDTDATTEILGLSPTTYQITTVTALPNTTKEGYIFQGWKPFVSSGAWSANTIYKTSDTFVGKYGSVSLCAQWAPEVYAVTLAHNGGSLNGTTENFSFYYKYQQSDLGYFTSADCATAFDAIGLKPTRVGYNFQGYYDGDLCFIDVDGNVTTIEICCHNRFLFILKWKDCHRKMDTKNISHNS